MWPHSLIHWIRFEKCTNTYLNMKLILDVCLHIFQGESNDWESEACAASPSYPAVWSWRTYWPIGRGRWGGPSRGGGSKPRGRCLVPVLPVPCGCFGHVLTKGLFRFEIFWSKFFFLELGSNNCNCIQLKFLLVGFHGSACIVAA